MGREYLMFTDEDWRRLKYICEGMNDLEYMNETQCTACPEYGYCDHCARSMYRRFVRKDKRIAELENALRQLADDEHMINDCGDLEHSTHCVKCFALQALSPATKEEK